MRLLWTGDFLSSNGRLHKDGTRLTYKVSLFDDGSASCSCQDYIIRGVNSGKISYRCKHIRQAAEDHPEWTPGSAAQGVKQPGETSASSGPTPPASVGAGPHVDGLTFDDIARRTRRRL